MVNFAGAQQVSSYAVYDIHGEKIPANRAEKIRADLGTHVMSPLGGRETEYSVMLRFGKIAEMPRRSVH
jgi:hypothetical protein